VVDCPTNHEYAKLKPPVNLKPVTLIGRFVTLEPIDIRHAAELFEIMKDEEVCRYLRWSPPAALNETIAMIDEAKQLMARHESIVFAQDWNETGECIGSTRLLDVRPADRQVEIGSTFLARAFWRTPLRSWCPASRRSASMRRSPSCQIMQRTTRKNPNRLGSHD